MSDRGELGVAAVCCLLHSLVPGGSTWQWVRLLGRHVAQGGRATIFAPDGPLGQPARAAGIEVIPTSWDHAFDRGLWSSVGEHDVAVVHWEQGVMDVFARALATCGRAVLAVHGTPQAVTRWFAPPMPVKASRTLELAVAEPHAVALARGEAHRRKVATAYGVPEGALRILPASVPLPSLPFRPTQGEPREVLAMTRLAPGKETIPRLAVELVRERIDAGKACRLSIAGDGPLRMEAVALCERRLRRGSWQIESAPEDPMARLAAADLVVAQGTTTLEAAALGKRVVVARSLGARGASGAALTPDSYDQAARDPFGDPGVTEDAARLWQEILALDETDLSALRHLVERYNSIEVASRTLGEALAATWMLGTLETTRPAEAGRVW
jgi:hypothetical protein